MRYCRNRNELQMQIVNELWATYVAQFTQVQTTVVAVRDTGTLVSHMPLVLCATGTLFYLDGEAGSVRR